MNIDYLRTDDTIEVIVRDSTGRKIGKMKVPINDKKRATWLYRTLNERYGFEPEIKEFKQEKKEFLFDDKPKEEKVKVDFWGFKEPI